MVFCSFRLESPKHLLLPYQQLIQLHYENNYSVYLVIIIIFVIFFKAPSQPPANIAWKLTNSKICLNWEHVKTMENESEVLGYKVSDFFISLIRDFGYNTGTEIWWEVSAHYLEHWFFWIYWDGWLMFIQIFIQSRTSLSRQKDFLSPILYFSCPLVILLT